MNDTTITVVGNVVDAPRRTNTQNGPVTNFRLASTARRYDAKEEGFVDTSTLWIDIECWNSLGANVSASLTKGDPVIVRGNLRTDSWESESGRRSKPQVRAFAVGLDLAKGRAVFQRDRPGRAPDDAASGPLHPESSDPTAGYPDAGELQPGRDYDAVDETLHREDDPDLSQEPAHA